ncbi:MAG: DUF4446 family protein [Actinomycetota bacterium]|nr:DUF4446 family protein [Actinomycetota bacterium]
MLENNLTAITVVIGSAVILLAAFALYIFMRLRRIQSEYDILTRGTEGKSFIEIINDNIAETDVLLEEVTHLSDMSATLLRRMAGSIQHIGVVRYDAFREIGGLMSFSIALLDDRGNGIVLTSIYGRTESRTYTKPIFERSSNYELSPEEKEAIRLAMQSREMGALPAVSRDVEHEQRMETLRLFQERESQRQASARKQNRPGTPSPTATRKAESRRKPVSRMNLPQERSREKVDDELKSPPVSRKRTVPTGRRAVREKQETNPSGELYPDSDKKADERDSSIERPQTNGRKTKRLNTPVERLRNKGGNEGR